MEPAPETAAAIDLSTSPIAFQAWEPLPLTAEPGGRVRELHKLVDLDRRGVAVLRRIEQPHAILLRHQCDRSNSFSDYARAEKQEVVRIEPYYTIERHNRLAPFSRTEDADLYFGALRKMGLPER